MTLQSSGPIRALDISGEFGFSGSNNSVSLGAYRVSQNFGTLTGLRLAGESPNLMPGPGETIRFSDFYGRRLNMVVDLYSIGDYSTRLTARNFYNDSRYVKVVGGFKTRPNSTSGTKVFINVNKIIGSDTGSRTNCALRTGAWETDTTLIMEIGSGATITGAGGKGGNGATSSSSGQKGGDGSSALGIEYPTQIRNRGIIQSGQGGGGGGASKQGFGSCARAQAPWLGRSVRCSGCSTPWANGGGGAGGRGYPAGQGGSPGGTGGNIQVGGGGGAGGNVYNSNCSTCSKYATGGTGGGPGDSGGGASGCYINGGSNSAGGAGAVGSAILATTYSGTTLNNYNAVRGSTDIGTPT
jgi:hypothetical protein